MHVFVDQSKLLKGNADLTEEAQAQLQSALAKQELQNLFPEYFQIPRPSYGSSPLQCPA